ncbi:hypothetical protein DTO282F9_3941 [Paecilomyces variotii]|nr:hypothetical protein DTO282F9_3941 [Paecilomyces variotii]
MKIPWVFWGILAEPRLLSRPAPGKGSDVVWHDLNLACSLVLSGLTRILTLLAPTRASPRHSTETTGLFLFPFIFIFSDRLSCSNGILSSEL